MNELVLSRHCFLISARQLPPRQNQRPGVVLLTALDEPLCVELSTGESIKSWALLFAPETKRRFVVSQPHLSLTIEPGHAHYLSFLRWARECDTAPSSVSRELSFSQTHAADWRDCLPGLKKESDLERRIEDFLVSTAHPRVLPTDDLIALFELLDATSADDHMTAERLWREFRATRAGSQSSWSRWLQAELGLSLRKLVLWRKLRRAMDRLGQDTHATRVAYDAGFADSAHLSRLCLRTFGLRPNEASNRKILQVRTLHAT